MRKTAICSVVLASVTLAGCASFRDNPGGTIDGMLTEASEIVQDGKALAIPLAATGVPIWIAALGGLGIGIWQRYSTPSGQRRKLEAADKNVAAAAGFREGVKAAAPVIATTEGAAPRWQ